MNLTCLLFPIVTQSEDDTDDENENAVCVEDSSDAKIDSTTDDGLAEALEEKLNVQ